MGGATAIYQSPANVSLIKYWGDKNNKPLNSSISINYDADIIGTITRVTLQEYIYPYVYVLNNKVINISDRMMNVFNKLNEMIPLSKEFT